MVWRTKSLIAPYYRQLKGQWDTSNLPTPPPPPGNCIQCSNPKVGPAEGNRHPVLCLWNIKGVSHTPVASDRTVTTPDATRNAASDRTGTNWRFCCKLVFEGYLVWNGTLRVMTWALEEDMRSLSCLHNTDISLCLYATKKHAKHYSISQSTNGSIN